MRVPKITWAGDASECERASASAAGARYAREGFATRGRRILTYVLLGGVMLAVAAMSWSGLFAFFTGPMHWTPGHSLLGPVALDIAAIVCAGFAMDRIDKGESGTSFRFWALVLVGMSAFVNWRGALPSHDITQEAFFPIMSVVVYGLFHSVMGAASRDVRREQHGHKAKARLEPLPRFGVLVWVPWIGAPRDAMRSVQGAVRKRLAVTAARTRRPVSAIEPGSEPASRVASESASASESRPPAVTSGHGSQSAAIRLAIDTLGREQGEVTARAVVAYLAEQGQQVPIGRVNDVMRRDRLRVVGAEEATG